MDPVTLAIGAGAGLVLGLTIGKFVFGQTANQRALAEKEAAGIVKDAQRDAESLLKQKELEAKERTMAIKAEWNKKKDHRNKQMAEREKKLNKRDRDLNKERERIKQRDKEFDGIRASLEQQQEAQQLPQGRA